MTDPTTFQEALNRIDRLKSDKADLLASLKYLLAQPCDASRLQAQSLISHAESAEGVER